MLKTVKTIIVIRHSSILMSIVSIHVLKVSDGKITDIDRRWNGWVENFTAMASMTYLQ